MLGPDAQQVLPTPRYMDPSQRSHTSFEPYERRFTNDPTFQKETTHFQEQKKRYLIQNGPADEDEWRTAIKQQLEEELDRRVREALETPPSTSRFHDSDSENCRSSRKQNKLQNLEELSSQINPSEANLRDRAYSSGKQWKIIQAERKLRRFMQNQNTVHVRPNNDYVLNADLFGYGSSTNMDFSAFPDLPGHIKSHKRYLQVTRKAEKDLGSLSTVERFEFFYAFTKSGCREAMRLGRLPDGSDLKSVGNGKFKDKYGILRDEHGPFWPPDTGPLFPSPSLIRNIPPKAEPVLESICENFRQTVDSQHHKYNQKWRGVQIVYDSEKCGRLYEPPPVSEGNAPSLLFESRFESANLRQARRIGQFEYELVLKTDLYTQRHTQWYYFQVKRPLPGVTYKFKIVNLLKRTSLYSHGMRPLLYSERDARVKRVGWTRTGHHISYYKNEHNLQCPLLPRDRTHYILEWQMEFAHADDTYYLAHCYPYTYTDLKDDLDNLLSQSERSKVLKREVMCETRAGNSCFLLTVTNFEKENNKEGEERKSIVVTARVHPGETNSSWMMKGLLEFITSNSQVAKTLRDNFIFKIVPMLNPDGVIVGNYRCSLAARDLNRNYRHPRKESFPTIWHTKDMLEEILRFSKVLIYCDMHGHSRKQNVFMYGCNTKDNKNGTNALRFSLPEQLLKERLFPWLMAMKAPDKFSFRGCKFAVRKSKEATGRVVMFKQMKISNSFTMEATFCGTNICRGDRRHFTSNDFEQMGKVFCEVTLDYHQMQQNKRRQSEMAMNITRAVAHQVLECRGMLPPGLPDFTTEKGQEELKGLCSEKYADTTDMFARALAELLKQDHLLHGDNLSKAAAGKNGDIEGMSVEQLVELLSARTVDGCVHVLEQLNADENDMQSESSSDSDSESEPEMVYQEPKHRKKKKKSKKKSQSEHGSAAYERKKRAKQREQEQIRPKSVSTSNVATRMTTKSLAKTYPGFVNKYTGRTNGGIPCFSEERLMERTAKRMEEMKRRLDDDQYQRDALFFSEFGQASQARDYLPGSYMVSQGRGTTFDMPHFGQTSSTQVRTGYMHAESPTSPVRRSDASSDDESDDEIPQHHPVSSLHSPYQHYPLIQHHASIPPTRVQRLPPLANSLKRTYTNGTPKPNGEPDSCSIPLRHTTPGMLVTSMTTRDDRFNQSGSSTAHVVNQVPMTGSHKQKTFITFPKIACTNAIPVARHARKHGERHATCE